MGEIVLRSQLRWTFAASACLHAGVAVLLALRISTAEKPVPIGVELLYTGEIQQAPEVVPTIKAVNRQSVVKAKPEKSDLKVQEAPMAQAAPTSQAQGPVGRADGVAVSALERYKYELRLFLESRKIYPETAKRLQQTGTVVVQFKVDQKGDLSDVNLEKPSASEILNRAALELVRRASRFKPVPSEANVSELKLTLPIEYIL